ncbi:hypothetical protein ACLFKX_15725 [Enterobacter hormaechei]
MLPDTHRGHVDNFSDYVDDLRRRLAAGSAARTVAQALESLADSMGGAISTPCFCSAISTSVTPLR